MANENSTKLTDAVELLEQAGHILDACMVAMGGSEITKAPASIGTCLILNDVRLRVAKAGEMIAWYRGSDRIIGD